MISRGTVSSPTNNASAKGQRLKAQVGPLLKQARGMAGRDPEEPADAALTLFDVQPL